MEEREFGTETDWLYDVCVVGGASLDRTFRQKTPGGEFEPVCQNPGGKGSNQAVAASRAGVKVAYISKLGSDVVGEDIVINMVKNHVAPYIRFVAGLNNDLCDAYVSYDGENELKRQTGAINAFDIDLIETYANVIQKSTVVMMQLKAPKEFSSHLINYCHEIGKPIILTPCRPERLVITEKENRDLIDKVTYITCNQKECETIFGTKDIESCVAKYPNKLIVTLGENGLMYHDGKQVVKIRAVDVQNVVDTTGAGDTLAGNFAALISKGVPMKTALEKATCASAIKIQHETAQKGMPMRAERDKLYEKEFANVNTIA